MQQLIHAEPLAKTASALRSGQRSLVEYVRQICDRIDAVEPEIAALVPEERRRARLLRDAAELESRFPDASVRPPLYGVLIGVKDIFHADGFVTRAGSKLPPELFAGDEAASVRMVKDAGALILGKAVTTEFAGFAQNGTRNPHNPEHTPGGSSSGSAAAVAAGYCSMAFGSQTVGSVIRPAAFCGVVGFKPSYGRIPIDGVVPYSPSVDTVGMFTADVASMQIVASMLCRDWQHVASERRPVLGVPNGAYLQQASPEGLDAFERQVVALESAGYTVKRVQALDDIAEIDRRHRWMANAEAAGYHRDWLGEYGHLYRDKMREVLDAGLEVTPDQLELGRASRAATRHMLAGLMDSHGLDLWICPAAPGPAPHGIESTGDPVMNLIWTHAGLPALSLPAGFAANGLPLGLQVVGRFGADEQLLAWAEYMDRMVDVRVLDPA